MLVIPFYQLHKLIYSHITILSLSSESDMELEVMKKTGGQEEGRRLRGQLMLASYLALRGKIFQQPADG